MPDPRGFGHGMQGAYQIWSRSNLRHRKGMGVWRNGSASDFDCHSLSEGCSFEYCHAHLFFLERSFATRSRLRSALSSGTRLTPRQLRPRCSANNNSSNSNQLVACLDPRRKGRHRLAQDYLARQRLNNNRPEDSLVPLKIHRLRLVRVCLDPPSNNSNPQISLDLLQLGLREQGQVGTCLDPRILNSNSSRGSLNSNHNKSRSLVARQPLRPSKIPVEACSEAQLGLPSHQLGDCLALERRRKAVVVISLEILPRHRQPPEEGCLERGTVLLPEGISLDRQPNRRSTPGEDCLDRNLPRTLNPLVLSLVRLRRSNL